MTLLWQCSFFNCFSSSLTVYRSLKSLNEENLPVENNDLSLFPLHLVGNQLEVTPSIRTENGAHERKQLDSAEVESHSSEDDVNENEYECASFKTDQHGLNQIADSWESEVAKSDTSGSEEVSTIREASPENFWSSALLSFSIDSRLLDLEERVEKLINQSKFIT